MKNALLKSFVLSATLLGAGEASYAGEPDSKTENAPIFVKDPAFELKMLDYEVRRMMHRMLTRPAEMWFSDLLEMSLKGYDDPAKASLVHKTIQPLLKEDKPLIRGWTITWWAHMLCENNHHDLRAEVTEAIGAMKPFLADEDAGVRAAAVRALGDLGNYYDFKRKECFGELVKMLGDKDADVRKTAVFHIGYMGEKTMPKETLDALMPMIGDPDPEVAEKAKGFIDDIIHAGRKPAPEPKMHPQP